jgi:hypothetical protein
VNAEEVDKKERHKQRHVELHANLDELTADFLAQNQGKRPSVTTVSELMKWSFEQTKTPTESPTDETFNHFEN